MICQIKKSLQGLNCTGNGLEVNIKAGYSDSYINKT